MTTSIAGSGLALLVGGLVWGAPPFSALTQDPTALWRVVHDLCAMDKRLTGLPAPCVGVDLRRGVAVVRDVRHVHHLLVVPLRRITGIEDAALLAPGAPNYWEAAWESRGDLDARAGPAPPREFVGLAVNSIAGRSQEQLHIHVACVRETVRLALTGEALRAERGWRRWRGWAGRRYRLRVLPGENLGGRDLFQLVARELPRAWRETMGRVTLAAIGARMADGGPGFVVLADRSDPAHGDPGHAEELLDHDCAGLALSGPR